MFASEPDGQQVFDNPTGWVAEHIRRYVESDGAKGHRYYGHDTLLLTTRGRRSGRLRRTALYYGRDGDRYVLVGSNGGSRRHPAWYFNVLADPNVLVQVKAERFAAVARPATAAERPRLWELMTQIFPTYADYQQRSKRELPVVVVEPVPGRRVAGRPGTASHTATGPT
jgi:deazaflavin-dependent oxidoreductase (nitroreductase family)